MRTHFAFSVSSLLFSSSNNSHQPFRPTKPTSLSSMKSPIADIGEKLSHVDTPALIVDMDAFERNLVAMREYIKEHNKNVEQNKRIRLRPHAKTHKCAEISLMQMEMGGAEGICVQKLDEAFAMVEGGVTDILLTNQVVGKKKIQRLIKLAQHPSKPKLSILVDNLQNLHDIASCIKNTSPRIPEIGVLIEINSGQNRCGLNCEDQSTILDIGRAIRSYEPTMVFKGIHCYGGNLQHVRSLSERRDAVFNGPVAAARKVVALLEKNGMDCPIITGAGTGTFEFEMLGGIHNEIQPGSYIFMDVDYGINDVGKCSFENALFVHTTVVSTSVKPGKRTVVDAGLKARGLDCGPPAITKSDFNAGVCGAIDARVSYESGGDEHGILVQKSGSSHWKVGDTLRMIPGHVDPTVNLHDWLVCVRSDHLGVSEPVVTDVWRVAGRGPGL